MAKTRDNYAKKETGLKVIKKPRKAKKKISIPMILTCDGDMTSLLPLFVNFSEMLCKRITKDVRKISGGRRKKATTKKKAVKKTAPTLQIPPPYSEDEPIKRPLRRGPNRRASNINKNRKPVAIRQRKRRQWLLKRPALGTRQKKRKSLVPRRYVKPAPGSPMDDQPAEISASETTGPCAESGTNVAASHSPVVSGENLATVARASNVSINESMASFMMLISAERRDSNEAFSGADEGQHSAGRYATKQISYNFQDAWNEAVNCQDSDADLFLQPQCLRSVSRSRVRLPGCPEGATSLDQSHVSGTAEECSIFNYIRKSLGEICPSVSSHPSTSTQSEQCEDNVVDIYSHIRSSLGEESCPGNGDSLT